MANRREGIYIPGYAGLVLGVEDVRAILDILRRRDRQAWREIVVWLSQEDETPLSERARRAFQGALMEWRMQSRS